MSTQKTCYTQIKRIFDIFFSFIGLAILSPVFIWTTIMVVQFFFNPESEKTGNPLPCTNFEQW